MAIARNIHVSAFLDCLTSAQVDDSQWISLDCNIWEVHLLLKSSNFVMFKEREFIDTYTNVLLLSLSTWTVMQWGLFDHIWSELSVEPAQIWILSALKNTHNLIQTPSVGGLLFVRIEDFVMIT